MKKQSTNSRCSVVRLRGRMDTDSAQEFKKFTDKLLTLPATEICFLADHLDYISSSGIALLIEFVNALEKKGGSLVIAGAVDEIRMLFSVLALDKRIPLTATYEEAETLFKKKREGGSFKVEPLLRPVESEENIYDDPEVTASSIDRGRRQDRLTLDRVDTALRDLHHAIEGIQKTIEDGVFTEKKKQLSSKKLSTVKNMKTRIESFDKIAGQASSTSGDETIVVCAQCGSYLRVHHAGEHRCPSCSIEFNVLADGSISFFEKLAGA